MTIAKAESNLAEIKPKYAEKDLHPFLAYYAYFYLKAYAKTIRHARSRREFSEWLHPDLVGCYFPIGEWNPAIINFEATVSSVSVKLFSFELKRKLNFSNLRSAFFQAVSNSSWANEGYLVAAEIHANADFIDELKRLSTSFGIGVLKLDVTDPDSSEIIIPARFKEALDWDAINKLAINEDFESFLRRVTNDIASKEIRKEKYDKALTREELLSQAAQWR